MIKAYIKKDNDRKDSLQIKMPNRPGSSRSPSRSPSLRSPVNPVIQESDSESSSDSATTTEDSDSSSNGTGNSGPIGLIKSGLNTSFRNLRKSAENLSQSRKTSANLSLPFNSDPQLTPGSARSAKGKNKMKGKRNDFLILKLKLVNEKFVFATILLYFRELI